MKIRFLELFDYILFFSVVILISIGISFIYSSGVNSSGISVSNEYVKQIIFASIGIFLMIGVSLFDYRKLEKFSFYFYIGFLAILVYTMIFGRYVNGARSWLGIGSFGIQPSEFGKIFFILYFASFLEKSQKTPEFKRFIQALIILAIPMGLILIQPDLGTASVYIPIFLIMCFVAEIPLRYIILVFSAGMLTIVFTVLPIWETEILQKNVPLIDVLTNFKLRLIVLLSTLTIAIFGLLGDKIFRKKYFYWIMYVAGIISFSLLASLATEQVLKPYQIKRLIVFMNPQTDPLNSGWNIIQSKIAIGSGSLFGQGFLQGTQSHYRFLPQQSTDFIFSILSEELGFVGGFFVFSLFLIILLRCIYIIKNTTNIYGYYIAAGIMFMIFFHFIVNVGMVMGIMPITGIPLLFLSYGGSSLWTAMMSVGLLMSINYRRLDF